MRIEVNGNPLEVDVLGRSGAPTLIAHHGAPGLGSRAEPRNTFGTLTDVMQVVVYDARGSGASGLTPPFTHRQWVADLDGLREHVGAESIVVAGGSYGGFIALEYALAHPQRVRAVILRDTAADNRHDQAARRNAIESSRVDLDLAKFNRIMEGRTWDDQDLADCWRHILPLYDHSYDPARVEERLSTTVYHHATHNFAFTNNMPGYDILDRLTDILCPVLVTVGRDDWIVPVAESEAIAERIPRAQLVVFERSGHSPQIEEAERFQAVMRNFLRDAGIVERS
jgi:proline iminopeptidase